MFINLIFVIACVSHYCSHFVCVWHMCLNTLRIANLAGGAFGFFYCLCSFDICTRRLYVSAYGLRLNMTSCVGVNVAIYISSVRESSFKRSAFAFARCKKLCIWRHLLLLSAVIHESHSPISPDWHHLHATVDNSTSPQPDYPEPPP